MLLQTFNLNNVNMVAACQQLALCCGIYENASQAIQDMLGPDGEILLWQRQTSSWPPSYCVIRTREGKYFVAVEGTTNFTQALLHDWGTFIRDDYFGSAKVNGAWIAVYVELRNLTRKAIPQNLPAGDLCFSGHSYGGAVAYLAALDYVTQWGANDVQLMTFGEPRSMEAGFTGKAPSCHWRFRSRNDPVPGLPPNSREIYYLNALFPTRWTITTAAWQHYGTELLLYPGGTVNEPGIIPDPVPEWVSLVPIEEHSLRNYWGRLNVWNQRFGA